MVVILVVGEEVVDIVAVVSTLLICNRPMKYSETSLVERTHLRISLMMMTTSSVEEVASVVVVVSDKVLEDTVCLIIKVWVIVEWVE